MPPYKNDFCFIFNFEPCLLCNKNISKKEYIEYIVMKK